MLNVSHVTKYLHKIYKEINSLKHEKQINNNQTNEKYINNSIEIVYAIQGNFQNKE